jgi:hypothetical protein
MGGRSSLERDAHMRELISAHIKETALKLAVPASAKSNRRDEPRPALPDAPVASQGKPIDSIEPPSVKTNIFATAPMQSASLAPMLARVPVAPNALQASAQVAARWLPPPPADAPMPAPATTVMEKSTLPPTISNQPQLVKTITIHTRPAQSASLAPIPPLGTLAANAPQPGAQVAARWLPSASLADQSDNIVASAGQCRLLRPRRKPRRHSLSAPDLNQERL